MGVARSGERILSTDTPSVSAASVKQNQSVQVSVSVTNIGNREGAEVVQLYIRDVVSSLTRPVKELKDFKKITLKAGETQVVSFTITPDKLSFYNLKNQKVVEAGTFEVMVGTASDNTQTVVFEVVE